MPLKQQAAVVPDVSVSVVGGSIRLVEFELTCLFFFSLTLLVIVEVSFFDVQFDVSTKILTYLAKLCTWFLVESVDSVSKF